MKNMMIPAVLDPKVGEKLDAPVIDIAKFMSSGVDRAKQLA